MKEIKFKTWNKSRKVLININKLKERIFDCYDMKVEGDSPGDLIVDIAIEETIKEILDNYEIKLKLKLKEDKE